MAMWHGCRGLDHLLRRPCDLVLQLSHMQQIQLAGACQVCTCSVSQPQVPIQASLLAPQIRLQSLSTWQSDREFVRTWDHGNPGQAAAQPFQAQRWPQQATSSLPVYRSFAASASDAAQPAKAALSQRMLAQKPAKRSAPAKATEKPEPTKQNPLRMTQGGHTANINTPMMARKGAFQQQSMSSVNVIVEPYKGRRPRQPLKDWFTWAGWAERKDRFLSNFKSVYTLHKCRQRLKSNSDASKKWGLLDFKQDALATYIETCQALAAGDLSALRQAATPAVFSGMKSEIQRRRQGGWARVHWAMKKGPAVREVETIQGRVIALNPKDDTTAFVQLTARIPSQQAFAAYDARGKLIQGDPDKAVPVDDVWVFERTLRDDISSRWRCAGRLGSMATIQAQQQQRQQKRLEAGASTPATRKQPQSVGPQPALMKH